MKYLVDAQLPYLLADVLRHKGFDVVHTDDLPDRDETSDTMIRQVAHQELFGVTYRQLPERLRLRITTKKS